MGGCLGVCMRVCGCLYSNRVAVMLVCVCDVLLII